MSVLSFAVNEYLASHEEILSVYLFGSQAEGCARRSSDLDLAVLLRSGPEQSQYSDHRLRLLNELSILFPQQLDLIILNQVPPLLQFQVLQKGQLLFDRDPDARAEIEMHMLNRYYDMRRYYEFHFGRLMERIKHKGLGHGLPCNSSQTQEAR
jgi:predicted nucleotidyltransferase